MRAFGVLCHYMAKHCASRGLDYLEKAINAAGEDRRVRYSAAQQKIALLCDLGRGAEEAVRCDRELEADQTDVQRWLLCVAAHHFAGENERALELAEDALSKFPENAALHIYAGDICRALKLYDRAFAYWRRAQELDKVPLDAYYSKGSCYEELGRYESAYQVWQELHRELVGRGPAQALAQLYKTFIDCISLAVRIFSLSLLYVQLSAVFGAALCSLMVIEIVVGIVSNREFSRLYGAELPKERKLSYIGDLLTQKGAVFDLKINQSVGYVKKLRRELADSVLKERVGINLKAERWYLINVLLTTAWTAALMFTLITGRLNGTVGLGTFCALLGSYPLLTQYQASLSYYLSSIGKDWFIVKALKDLFDYREIGEKTEIVDSCPEIVFSNVSFKYPGTERYVLRDINFTLSPRETVALVGPNGSGKSTVIKLICGLYEPTEGTITVGGTPVSALSKTSGKRLFSAVFQDFLTYDVTIAENVGLGDIRDLDHEEKIKDALKNAGMDRFVSSLPKGMDTKLGHLEEGGVELSGGQRQRLALARAYLSDAWFYLLDEPTAAMDPLAESRLYQSFSRIIRGKGAVLVSHRLASASIADRILVLRDGEIIVWASWGKPDAGGGFL